MASIKASTIVNAIQAAIVVTLTPTANGLSTRDMRFFSGLSSEISEYLQNCDPVEGTGNLYESKPPVWLQDDHHKDFWVVRVVSIPLKNTNLWLGVDLRFADGKRGYVLQEAVYFVGSNSLRVTDVVNNSSHYYQIAKAANFNKQSLIEDIYSNLSNFLEEIYKDHPSQQPLGTASFDEVVAGLKAFVTPWNRSNGTVPDWEVYIQDNTIRVEYEYTFRRNTRAGEWRANSALRSAGSNFGSIIAEAKRLNAKITIVSQDILTKEKCEKADELREMNEGSAYSEYEQSVGGSLILKL